MKHLIVWISTILFGGLLFIASFIADAEKSEQIELQSVVTDPLSKMRNLTEGALNPVKSRPDFSSLPIQFIPNLGQEDARVMFFAKTSRYTLWIVGQELVFSMAAPAANVGGGSAGLSGKMKNVSYSLSFPNARTEVIPTAQGKSGRRVNYLLGSDPKKWKTNIPASSRVMYKNLYEGIDLKVYGVEKKIEYDWIINPGSDPGAIVMHFKHTGEVRIDKNGNLTAKTALGEIVHQKPAAYQMVNRRKVIVEAEFRVLGDNRFGFRTGAWDKSKPLIIDPVVLTGASFVGGNGGDYGVGICTIGLSNYYVIAGNTYSSNFPSRFPGCHTTTAGNLDVFIAAIDGAHGCVEYMTFLGGSGNDRVYAICKDNAPHYIWLAGETESVNFPLRNPLQSQLRGSKDAFMIRISAEGFCPLFSTYLGGYGEDSARAVASNIAGYAYFTGKTSSSDFPMANPYQSTRKGPSDGFVCKLRAATSSGTILYSTYLGGNQSEEGHGITVDSANRAYVTGFTNSFDFPVRNGVISQAPSGLGDAFVTQLSATGNSLVYSTYLGGASGWEEGNAIALDSSNNIYIAGSTSSSNFVPAAAPAYDRVYNGYMDVFVTKLTAGGQSYGYSTYVGGYHNDYGLGLVLGPDNGVWVTGYTSSSNFPLKDATPLGNHWKEDAFVFKLSPNGLLLSFSTLLGGVEADFGRGIALGQNGTTVAATGETLSNGFPTQDACRSSLWGGSDAFFTVFSIN